MKRRKRGDISPEDHALWVHVARTTKPLKGRQRPELPEPVEQAAPLTPSAVAPVPQPRPTARVLPPLTGLDRRLRRDVSRGQRAIEARIDLHGMRQAEAHRALLDFLHQQHHRGAKLVLVITGKGGAPDAFGQERGVLRRMVPHWLADPLMRRIVLGYEAAAPTHGGDGALYVRVRAERHQTRS